VNDIARGQNVGSLWASAARRHGDRPFLVWLGADGSREEYSYRQFDERINRAANALTDLGVGARDLVAVQLRNSPDVVMCLFALAKLGAVTVPIALCASPGEVAQMAAACRPAWTIVDAGCVAAHRALRGAGAVDATHPLIVVGGTGTDDDTRDLAEACRQASPLPPAAGPDSGALAELLYTSGTTAEPKGVMVTQANLVFAGHYGVWETGLRPDDRLFTPMPACHSNFQLAALMPVLVAGACLVLAETYSAHRFWAQVRENDATLIQIISMIVRTLLLQPPDPRDADNRVRDALFFMGLSDTEKDAFERRFGVTLLNTYGSTESIGWALTDPPVGERRWPSVGRPGLGYEVGVFGAGGSELPVGAVGELRIKGTPGTSLMAGYYDNPAETERVLLPGGWLRTHDLGYRDADGWFYYVGRDRDVIKRSGENISAAEVEQVLTAHPEIAEAAVIGVPDPIRDEAVKAFVRRVPGSGLRAQDVVDHCRRELIDFKVPSQVEFVDDFPRTPSMKIEKRLLRRPSEGAQLHTEVEK
jgi:crotonobetaine/carnitine-CoA ligase